jgi:serpin B
MKSSKDKLLGFSLSFLLLASVGIFLFFLILRIEQHPATQGNSLNDLNHTNNGSTTTVKLLSEEGSTSEGLKELVDGNNQLAFDLYAQYKAEDENVFYSPYSIITALSMTYEGARGKTAEEMASVLHLPSNASIRQPAFAKLFNEMNKKGKKYQLNTANALWAQKDFTFLPDYFNTIDKYYGGKVENVDFVHETEAVRKRINTWVEDQTNKKIQNLIPEGILNEMTRLVLTNAIYFKGTWLKQFDSKETSNMDFYTSGTVSEKVPMMHLPNDEEAKFNYAETNDLQVLELPYTGSELSMLILLPKENDQTVVEKYLTKEKFADLKEQLKEEQVDIYLPKFKFETKYFLTDTLKKMGMKEAFTNAADFSGMDGEKDLMISQVIHQAFVEVNEEGTEAAAATAVVVELKATMQDIKEFKADHPFIFVIQQKSTGNILFMGRVSDPSK